MNIKPINGKSLKELVQRNYFEEIYPRLVSDSVESGIKKVEIFFGERPDIYGSNIGAFKQIRDCIFKISNGSSLINSLILVIPHTHWESKKPVIYQYDENIQKYIIGHHSLKHSQYYYPVSFVFFDSQIYAYEWIESNSKIDKTEFQLLYNLLESIANEIGSNNWPLGVNIDFRFKESLTEESIRTVEIPIEDNNFFDGFALIQKYSDYLESDNKEHIEQVAWSSISELSYDLSIEQFKILKAIRRKMVKIESDSERAIYINKLFNT